MSKQINMGNNIVNGCVQIQPAKGGSLQHKIITLKLNVNGRHFKKRILMEGSPNINTQLQLLVTLLAKHIVRWLLTRLGNELNILLQPHTEEEAKAHGVTLETPVQDEVTSDTP